MSIKDCIYATARIKYSLFFPMGMANCKTSSIPNWNKQSAIRKIISLLGRRSQNILRRGNVGKADHFFFESENTI